MSDHIYEVGWTFTSSAAAGPIGAVTFAAGSITVNASAW